MENKINNGLIAKNTLLLFFRMLLTILIQLYTVPIILRALGVEDYGLYNVIGSVMAMVSLVSFIASGCQRYFTYAIGEDNHEKLVKLFNSTQTIYVYLTITVIIFLEVAGLWFINNKMQIPEGRLVAAHWVFQLSTLSFAVGLLSAPYNALIIAHERMKVFAYITIITSFLKLAAALAIDHLFYDRLIFYALFILIAQLFERLFYQVYCLRHFEECRNWKFQIDISQSKGMFVFSGYNIIGAIAITLRKQGLNILMNIFFGTILNAAHGIALQIQGVMEQLINNIYFASRPQITKSYARGDTDGMWKLTYRTSLLSYYLMMVMSIVAIIELPTLLLLWLHEVPLYTVSICRIFVICLLMETITNQLIGVFQAINKIKMYQISSSLILLLYLPVSYLLLKINSSNAMLPYMVQFVFSGIYIISLLIISRLIAGLNIKYFIFHVFCREFFTTLFVFILVYYISMMIDPSLFRVILSTLLTIIFSFLFILFWGFEKSDLQYIRIFIKNHINYESTKNHC